MAHELGTMTRTPTTIALLAALAIPAAHAETPSSILQSLPDEVQKQRRGGSSELPGAPERRGR